MTTPLKAIRLKCLDCCCGSSLEVKLCQSPNCPLYNLRFGKNPNRKGIGYIKSKIVQKTITQPSTKSENNDLKPEVHL